MTVSHKCSIGGQRPLTEGEIALSRAIFGDAIDYKIVTIRRRKWFPLQPRHITMAPLGHLHFHPESAAYCDDFSQQSLGRQGFFIHEMAHIWQTQSHGKYYLIFRRMPWARYDYTIRPGRTLEQYGIEQQAEIIRHAFLSRNGVQLPDMAPKSTYDRLVDFPGAAKA